MADLPDEEVAARLPRLKVLPRADPLDKRRLVRLLRERGVVATGGDAAAKEAAGRTWVEGDLRGSRRPGVEGCGAARKTTARNDRGQPLWAGRGLA